MFSIKQCTCVLDLLQSPRGVLSYGGVLVQVFSASRQLEVDVSMADAVARQSDHNFHLYKYEPVTSNLVQCPLNQCLYRWSCPYLLWGRRGWRIQYKFFDFGSLFEAA